MAKPSLPRGWKIVSLHYADPNKPPRIGPRPSDAQIAQADAIRVSYTRRGDTEPTAWRTIHGAPSRAAIGHHIANVIQAPGGSPV
jgi:hypothetical protein